MFWEALSSVNAYGLRNYSCGTKIGHNTIAMVVLFILMIILFTIQLSNIEKRTFKKVLTYILVIILQYISIVIYDICMFLKIRNIILDALILTVISFGGIGNVIQYLYNDGLSNKNNTSNYRFNSNERSQQL
ncbi:hypothetical protein RhiirC2_777695 [Rhizophagus irregularis]|uniref:Uncharacterized protein n=1 Tax=Rhizophagus irregularis TaxID=588596 RepID=A0A2N1NDN8_9GLOM|nr:hypothetical protein RhiirC2_777695 [Rhizophagus irregularis]